MGQQNILLVTSRREQLSELAEELRKDPGVNLLVAASLQEALDMLRHWVPVMAIVDERVGGAAGLDLIRRFIEINAFVHSAVLSDTADETFHQQSEGLGILARLPLQPGEEDARRLLDDLRRVLV
jgi:ActR/RegA family two-component response regulator